MSQVLRGGVSLTTAEERSQIIDFVDEKCERLDEDDRAVLEYDRWLDGVMRGVAAHHAGLLPIFKETIEELFRRKLLKVVFATETLALGINMPARTVVIEKLEKFNGESRVPITAGEYTQLTGRAGRRGIDDEGHSVVLWSTGLNPEAVAALASRRSYPLKSSFQPTYNMAVNLIAQFGAGRTRGILESSFAQFQADRHVVELARTVRANEESLRGYESSLECHLGDFRQYHAIRREISDREREQGTKRRGDTRELGAVIAQLRTDLRLHPCHQCPDRETHARWAERWWKLEKDTERVRRQIRNRTGAISQTFDRVSAVLTDLGYLQPGEGDEIHLSSHGHTLRRIYGERDLLIAECVRRHAWTDLSPAELAAIVATLVYEPRRDDGPVHPKDLPGGAYLDALHQTRALHRKLSDIERDHQMVPTPDLAPHLALSVLLWAEGKSLEKVLDRDDIQAGDFVRWCKQIIDSLDQIISIDQGALSRTAEAARTAVFRGIVALSSVA